VIDETINPINHEKDCKNLKSGFQIVAAENINPINNEYTAFKCHPPE
jgi:hypothetical protein